MTSPRRNLTVLLLFLSASPFLHSHLSTQAASTPRPRPRIITMSDLGPDDYPDDDHQSAPPVVLHKAKTNLFHQAPTLCRYDPCLENQESCKEVSMRNGCLCPGISGPDEPPHAPRIRVLQPIGEGADRGKIEVQWCAPSSEVTAYRVLIEGSDALEFREALRRGLVGPLEVGTKVCVVAVNSAGHSDPSEFSCTRYHLPKFSDHKLFVGVIGGGVALLLLLIIGAVMLWKHQMRKKAKRDSADGHGNPSYSTEGTL